MSNASIKVTPAIVLRLVLALLVAGGAAWLGGTLTDVSPLVFIERYSMVFYAGCAVLGFFLLQPVIARQGDEDDP